MSSPSECKICGGKGIIVKNNIAYRCNCVKQKLYLKKFQRANLAGILKNQTFNNFNFKYYPEVFCKETNCSYRQAAKKIFNAAKKFCLEIEKGNLKTKGLMICGNVGSGKTFLAACIANRLLEKGIEVLFAVVPDLLDTIRATYDSAKGMEGQREISILDEARNVPLLILDDLGAHNYTAWTINKIYSILNYRVNWELPTIITTNEEMETLEYYLGQRTTSRISQLCNIYMLYALNDIRIIRSKENMHNKSSPA